MPRDEESFLLPKPELLARTQEPEATQVSRSKLAGAVGLLLAGAVGATALLSDGGAATATAATTSAAATVSHIEGDAYRASVGVELSEGSAFVAVAYTTDAGAALTAEALLASERTTVSQVTPTAAGQHDLTIRRLRAAWEYNYVVLAGPSPEELSPVSEVLSFTTASSDYDLPEGCFCENVEGDFTWDVLFLNYADTETELPADEVNGAIAIDNDCYVVWYHPSEEDLSVMAIDQMDDGSIALQQTFGRNAVLMKIVDLDHNTLQEVWYPDSCWENGEIPTWHHELSYDRDAAINDATGLPERFFYIDSEIIEWGDSPASVLQSDTMNAWYPETDELVEMASLADNYDPDEFFPVTYVVGPTCGAPNEGETIYEWSHGNALRTGTDNNIIYSSRFWASIHSFDADTGELQWTVTSDQDISDFEIPEINDHFSDQHGVWQLANGNLLMMDNLGYKEPQVDRRQTSRAIELALDFDTMEAAVVWAYEPDTDFAMYCCGGAWEIQSSGNRLAVFGGYSADGWDGNLVVETNEESETLGWLEVRKDDRYLYRAMPGTLDP